MPTTPQLRPHLEALVDHLTTHQGGDRFGVGDGEKPAGGTPYAVIYLLDGGDLDGPIADPEADLLFPFQATCVGRNQAEAAWVRDQVTRLYRTIPVHIPGRKVIRVRSTGGPGGVQRDDDHQPPLWYCTPRFVAATTPS